MSHAKERRQIAGQIFKEEKRRLLQHPDWLTKKQKRALRSYTFKLDRGTTRRGACHYPGVKDGIVTEGAISLSTAMVENAPSEELRQVVRHELAHACCPGDNHNATWRAFCLKIGGDGKSHDRLPHVRIAFVVPAGDQRPVELVYVSFHRSYDDQLALLIGLSPKTNLAHRVARRQRGSARV